MEARLQRRIQRYGWDLAARDYEPLWQAQLEGAQTALLAQAALGVGQRVLDVACGTGLVTFRAAEAVGVEGSVLGIDLSDEMIAAARVGARSRSNVEFRRMGAETLDLPDAEFDAVLCAFGLMYVPDPARAVREMRRVLKPGGRLAIAVWGPRARCGWSEIFPIVEAEVTSEVCPLFFRLGEAAALERLCEAAGLRVLAQQRLEAKLLYPDADEACRAAFVGGPVALAWSRFDPPTRARACRRYVDAISRWRDGSGFRVPAEFVILCADSPGPEL
jgi:ubiquinone/menaquinone biosynthesis C-methylase UbiE